MKIMISKLNEAVTDIGANILFSKCHIFSQYSIDKCSRVQYNTIHRMVLQVMDV